MQKLLRKTLLFQIFIIVSFHSYYATAQGIENKIEKFYQDLINGMQEAKNEKKDELAADKLKRLNAALLPRAEQLQIEVENHINTLSDDEILQWDNELKDKAFNKQIFDLTFDVDFIERIDRSSEFETAYNEIIDLSDKVVEVDFAEPVDPLSACSITLNGGQFKNQTFSLPSSGMKSAEAFSQEGELTFNIEGYSNKILIGLSFLTAAEKPGIYKWVGEYNLTLTYFNGTTEMLLGGHEGKGTITLEKVEDLGGWIEGKFAGKLESEGSKEIVDLKGFFKVRRNISPE